VATSREDLFDGLVAARARHAERSRGARVAQVLAGLALLVVGIPLSVVVPELGIPGVLFGLRLLADEYDWAARAYASIAWRWERFRTWFLARPGPVKVLVVLAMSIVAIALLALLA
jgi:hypothetical protein